MTLRMLHVLESIAQGGVETTFLNLLRAFADEARTLPGAPRITHDVLAFADGPLHRAFAESAAELIVSRQPGTLEALVARDYDVVHVLVERCAYRLAPLVIARSRSALVVGKNDDLEAMLRANAGVHAAAEDGLLLAADAVTFATPQLAAAYPMPADRTTILRKAADVARFSATTPVSPATPDRILCVADLHPRNRVASLAPVLQMVRQAVPSAELRVVGRGSPEQVARTQAALDAHGVSEAARLTGRSTDVAGEMAQARVVVLPSASEGVPTVLLESMAAGRPFVATRTGHIDHIVDDGVEGFVTDPDDRQRMAECLVTLLTDRRLAQRMGAAGQTRAAAHDVRGVAREMLGVLVAAAAAAPYDADAERWVA